MQNRLFDYLTELQDQGTTIVITGRDVDEIASVCNRIAIIENGEITVTPEEFAAENPDFREIPRPVPEEDDFLEDLTDGDNTEAAGNLEDTIVIIPAAKEEEAVKEAEEPTEEADEPAEEADEPSKEADEPAEEAEEPAEEADEPAKEAD